MNSQNKKSLSISASLLLTFAVGLPAVADDTELLLVDPANTVATPPNIMFILDASGSMGDPVETTEPYNSTQTYSGTGHECLTDKIYWTKLGVTPSCLDSGGNPNGQFFDKSAFLCEDAMLRMTGIGAYTGIMVQYSSIGGAPSRWQEIEIGDTTSDVECQNDSGEHGNGVTGQVYAQAGSDLTPFTSSMNNEISWGSGDASQVYTVYDGNYLNWKENPVTVDLPKLDIMKAVTRNLLNAVEDVNVGVMRFNDNEGGRILHAVSDINTNRGTILGTIQGLVDGGSTPIAETLYEAALYWRGLDAHYGDLQVDGNGDPTGDIDPNAFVSGPGAYQQPAMPVCTRNFNVLITDGAPVDDDGAQTLAPDLPDFDELGGRTACDDPVEEGHCLDDITEYLNQVDISASVADDQVVTTHTIGFDVDLDILKDAAEVTQGDYYLADDVDSLTTALLRIVENVLDKGLSFSAPAVAVNSFNRTQNFDDLYITTFLPDGRVHWPGNLKKYTLDGGVIKDAKTPGEPAVNPGTGFFDKDARSFWTDVTVKDGAFVEKGGAANELPDPSMRRVFTNYGTNNDLTAGVNAITPSNTTLTLADFGLTGAAGEPTLDEIIRWTRGEDVLDEDNNTGTTVRYDMGDPLHSQPGVIVYGSDPAVPEPVVYTATNDGYLHAINGDTGEELWSFIPKQLLSDLPELMLNGLSTFKHYGIDGDVVPVVADLDDNGIIDGSDFAYIIFGMRRGGSHYFALNVTDRDNPELLWQKTLAEFGQTWSRPVVARVDMQNGVLDAANTLEAVVIVGDGYDSVHDTAALPATPDNVGAGITMLDLLTGAKVWRAGRTNANLTLDQTGREMTRSIPSQVRVIDFTGDGFVDRMYAIDVGGQLFRFDVYRNLPIADMVTGGIIARFGGEGVATAGDTDTRRFYSSPDVSIFSDPVLNRRFLAIGIGSGYRAHPLDTSAADAYYSLRDPDVFAKLNTNAYENYDIAVDADMNDVAGQVNTVIGPNDRGWKLTVPAGQMILSGSATFDNSVFFIGYEPNAAAAATCQVLQGANFLYRVDVANGDPVANNLDTMTGAEADDARVTPLKQGGIAATPAFLFPDAADGCTDDCEQPPIGCVGVECFDPGFANNPVRTLWTQDGID